MLFDSRSETKPFDGVSYWARALDAARRENFPLKKFLVAARIDRTGPAVSRARIDEIVRRYGFDGYFETSAKRGDGVDQLRGALGEAITWSDLPAVTRTNEFQTTKTFLVEKKRRGTIVEEADALLADLRDSTAKKRRSGSRKTSDANRTNPNSGEFGYGITPDVFRACLAQLEATGLIRRLPFSDWVLLQPELLDDYCGWMTLAARAEPDGLGFLREEAARTGRLSMDADRPLAKGRKKEEQTQYRRTCRELFPLLSRIQNSGCDLGEEGRTPAWYRANRRTPRIAG